MRAKMDMYRLNLFSIMKNLIIRLDYRIWKKQYLTRLSDVIFRLYTFGIIGFIVLNASVRILYAHPHVFIVQRVSVVFDDQGLAGFKMRWGFDEMFSSMITGDYDRNQNGRLEAAEVQTIKEKAFNYLFNYNYFTFVKIDGKPFAVKYIKDFSAVLKENKLIYEFFIPCHVAAIRQFKKIIIATYDPSYYTAIFFAKNQPASLSFSESFEVKSAILKDKTTSIYYGMVHPWTLFLEFRLKQ